MAISDHPLDQHTQASGSTYYTVPLFDGGHEDFGLFMESIYENPVELSEAIDTLLGMLESNAPEKRLFASSRERLRLGQSLEALYRVLGSEHVLNLIIGLLQEGVTLAKQAKDADRQRRLQVMIRNVVQNLHHEATENVLSQQQFVEHILTHLVFTAKPEEGSFDPLKHMLYGSDELLDKYRLVLAPEYQIGRAAMRHNDTLARALEQDFAKTLRTSILSAIDWNPGSETSISVFDHLLSVVQAGLEHLGIAYDPATEALEDATERVWNNKDVHAMLQSLSKLVYLALEHKQRGEKQPGTTLSANDISQKNVLVLYGVTESFLRRIQQATSEEQKRFPDVYVHVPHYTKSSAIDTNRVIFDAWASGKHTVSHPVPGMTPQLLDNVGKQKEILQKESERHDPMLSMDSVNNVMYGMIQTILREKIAKTTGSHISIVRWPNPLAQTA